jgi:hypothetical protein
VRRRNILVQNRAATKTVEFRPLQVFVVAQLGLVHKEWSGTKKNKFGTVRYSGTGSVGF